MNPSMSSSENPGLGVVGVVDARDFMPFWKVALAVKASLPSRRAVSSPASAHRVVRSISEVPRSMDETVDCVMPRTVASVSWLIPRLARKT